MLMSDIDQLDISLFDQEESPKAEGIFLLWVH